MSARVTAALAATAIALALAACSGEPDPVETEAGLYLTHCGVGQTSVRGIGLYPVRILVGGEVVAVGSDPGAADSRWVAPDGAELGAADLLPDPFAFTTGGYYRLLPDGTAEFVIRGSDAVIELSRDRDEAAYRWDGCY